MEELRQLASVNRNVTLHRLLGTLEVIYVWFNSMKDLENESEFVPYRNERINTCKEVIDEELKSMCNLLNSSTERFQ